MAIADFLDRAIYTAFPRWGARRMIARRAWRAIEALREKREHERRDRRRLGAWEGAEPDRHRGSSWLGSRLSADSALEASLDTLREHSAELDRNNPWMASYTRGLVNYVVGSGRRPQAQIKEIPDLLTADQARSIAAQAEDLYERWQARAGIHDEPMSQLQDRIVRGRCVGGDVFAVLRDVGRADKPIPLAIELVAAERVETPPNKLGNHRIRLGIERDERGMPIAIYVRKTHPHDTKQVSQEFERIPIWDSFGQGGRKRVLQHYKLTWEGQSRGVPDCEPVITDLKDLDDLWEAQITRQWSQSCHSLFVKTGLMAPEDMADRTAAETTSNGKRLEEYSPGMVSYLRDGEEVQFASPEADDNLDPFMRWRLRGLAAGLNFPYELLVHHWENSYAGGRLALIDAHQRFRKDQQLLDSQVLEPLWEHVVLEGVLTGEIEIDERLFRADPGAKHFTRSRWLGDPLPWIDPQVEVESEAKSVAFGFDSHANVLLRRGIDPDQFLQERTAWRAKLAAAGIPELIPSGWTTVAAAEAAVAAQESGGQESGEEWETEDTEDGGAGAGAGAEERDEEMALG